MVMSKKELGNKIKEARKIKKKETGKKYTQAMLADDLSLSRGYIGDIENGRTYPNYVLLKKIAEICQLPLSFFDENIINETPIKSNAAAQELKEPLLDIQTYVDSSNLGASVVSEKEYRYFEKRVISIPVYSSITGAPEKNNISSFESVYIDIVNEESSYFGLISIDDSMANSRILRNDIVIVKVQSEVQNGDISVVSVADQEAIIRRFYRTNDIVNLVPETSSKEFQPILIDSTKTNLKVYGKVVKFIGRL